VITGLTSAPCADGHHRLAGAESFRRHGRPISS